MKVAGIIFFVLICLTAGLVFYPKQLHNEKPFAKPTPTPYPLYELTIPYLRQQMYKSSLQDITPVSENESYTSSIASYRSDGLKINGLLTQPKGTMPKGGWPVIVFLHGYIPPKQYETLGQSYSAYVDYLARNGFVVFKPDYRGNGDSEGKPGGAYYSSDYVIDALNAYAALQNAKFVNPKKIGIWGHSMSGNVSLRAMAAKPDIPAVVIWSGAGYSYVDLTKYKISDASYVSSQATASQSGKRGQLRKLYGNPDPSKLFWQQIAPTNYLKDLKGAIQLDQAVDDEAVNIGYSRDLANLLKKAKVKYEFNEYPSGGHNISGENFTVAMENTVAFFKKYLQ